MLLVATAVGLFFYEDHEATQLTVIAVFVTYAAVVLVDTIWRVMLAPFLPGCRLMDLSDQDARKLYRWLTVSSSFGLIGASFSYWVEGLGLPREMYVLITVVLMAVTVLSLLLLIRANRQAISGVILGGRKKSDLNWLNRGIAVLWAPLGSLYLLFAWSEISFRLIMGIEGGPGRLLVPYVTLIVAMSVYAGTIYAIERVFARQRQVDAVNAASRAAESAEAEDMLATRPQPDPADASWSAEDPIQRAGDGPDHDGGDDGGDDGDEEGGSGRLMMDLPEGGRPAARGPGMYTLEDLGPARCITGRHGRLRLYHDAVLARDGFPGRTPACTIPSAEILQVAFIGYIIFHANPDLARPQDRGRGGQCLVKSREMKVAARGLRAWRRCCPCCATSF